MTNGTGTTHLLLVKFNISVIILIPVLLPERPILDMKETFIRQQQQSTSKKAVKLREIVGSKVKY